MMMLESSRCHKQVHQAHISLLISPCLKILLEPPANVDASCFIIHSGVEVIAGIESLVGHSDGGEMIQLQKMK